MPQRCDTLDGPVVKAAMMTLETANANLILPWAPKKTEAELRNALKDPSSAELRRGCLYPS